VNVPTANISLTFVANNLPDRSATTSQPFCVTSKSSGPRSYPTSVSNPGSEINQAPENVRLGHAHTRVLSVPEEPVITCADHHKTVPEVVVIKFSWQPTEKAQVEAEALRRCSGRFGTPSFLYTLHLGKNHDFVPPSIENAERWSYFPSGERRLGLDRRELVATVCADSGASLEHCKSAWELGRALLDCHLGEYISYTQRFFSWALIAIQVGLDSYSAIAFTATSAWGISCFWTSPSHDLRSSQICRVDTRNKAWTSWSVSTRRPAENLRMH